MLANLERWWAQAGRNLKGLVGIDPLQPRAQWVRRWAGQKAGGSRGLLNCVLSIAHGLGWWVTLVLILILQASTSVHAQGFVWARAMGQAGVVSDFGLGVALDGAGNVYTVGEFAGTVDFDPGVGTFNLTSAGREDIFVSKLDGAGNFVWAAAMGGFFPDGARGVALDGDGNVYTVGNFFQSGDFDPGVDTFTLNGDIFISKLDANGNFVWARAMETDSPFKPTAEGVALDGADNVYTVGTFSGTIDFDPGAGTFNLTSAGDRDIFVSKLDANGDFLWARAMGGSTFDAATAVTLDGAGNVYTVGAFSGTVDFDPGAGTFNLTSAGSRDIFVSKLDSAGNFVWAAAMGGPVSDSATAVALDGAGNVYTVGDFRGTADFDPGSSTFNLTTAGQADIFVSKLDSAGNFVWAATMGGSSPDGASGGALDCAGNVYTVGSFSGTADFDPGATTFNLTSAGGDDIFVSKLDSTGNFVWAVAMGSIESDFITGDVAVDCAGNVYTVGDFRGTADFDPGAGTFNLTSAGRADIFVSKLEPVADLSLTKTDGVAIAPLGATLTYTITVANSGADEEPAATLSDTFPADLTCTYTSVASGGATGNTPAGAGDLAETLSMPIGSSVIYTVTCATGGASPGTLSNTATITSSKSDPTPANNSATDETILSPEADLEVSKTDGVTSIVPGETLTYTITATNNGPLDDPSATLVDSFPADLSCTYASAASGGATGNTVAGSGNLSETLSMPAGSSVTYTANCTVDPSATEKVLQNTATVATSRIDPTLGNNSATDDDTVVGARQADLEVTKSDDLVAVIPGQSLTYTIIATNKGPSDVPSATLTDSFPIDPHCNFYTSVASGGATGNTTAGSGDLGETLSMPAGSSLTYTVSCTVDTASSGTLSNTATIASSVIDPDPAKNSATDINDVLAATGAIQLIGPDESLVLDVADDSICEEIKPTQVPPSANGAVCINPAPTPSCSIDESTRTLNVDAGIGNLCVFVDSSNPVDFPDGGIRSATAIARLVHEFEIPERLTGDPATVPVQISTVVSWDGLLWPVPTLLPVFSQVTGTLQVRDVTSGLVLASNTFLFEQSGPTSVADTLVACLPWPVWPSASGRVCGESGQQHTGRSERATS